MYFSQLSLFDRVMQKWRVFYAFIVKNARFLIFLQKNMYFQKKLCYNNLRKKQVRTRGDRSY